MLSWPAWGSWHLPLLGLPSPKVTTCLPHWQVVEELLSGNPHIEKESARSIADGAMMEAASVCVGQMVRGPWGRGREERVVSSSPADTPFHGSRMPSLWLESVLLEGLSGRSRVPCSVLSPEPGLERRP